jgi:hypothetical protein
MEGQHHRVRILRLTACIAIAASVIAIGPARGATRPDSGIRGLVLYGPTCPVQRPGETCERPYQASIAIRREPSDTLAARVRSDPHGRFTVRLRAGTYRLQPRNGMPFPHARPQTVSVQRHAFTSVTIRFDSGIR